jgi:hypothetical protein
LKGKRSYFIKGSEKSAKGTLVLTDGEVDYTITRKITEKSQELHIESSDGRTLGQEWINSFFNEFLINPIAFARLSGKEQAEVLGIDTSEIDARMEVVSKEFTEKNAVLKSFGKIIIPKKVEAVDVSDLNKEKNEILAWNKIQNSVETQYNIQAKYSAELSDSIASIEKEISELKLKLKKAKSEYIQSEDARKLLPKPQPIKSYLDIDSLLSQANEVNKQANTYSLAVRKSQDKEKAKIDLEKVKLSKKRLVEEKVEYMKSLELPVSNITVDDKGGLLLDGRPIRQPHFSMGELLTKVPMILSRGKQEMKYVFLENFDLLDEENSEKVINYLTGQGYQVVVEKVSKREEGSIVFKSVT